MKKTAIITGGTKGLGLELAKIFVKEKYNVVITGRKRKDVLKVSREFGFEGEVSDIKKESDTVKLIRKVQRKFGTVDIFINNAGIWYPHTKITEVNIKKIDEVYDTNVFGVIYASKNILKVFEKQNFGILINIISTSSLTGRPFSSIYASSKWAVRGFTESIQEEYKHTNIKIIAVHPGGMKTNLFDVAKPKNYKIYMDQADVAKKIVENALSEKCLSEQIINRPGK